MKLKPTTLYTDELKPARIPEGFILLQDTREQKPLYSNGSRPEGLEVITTTLPYGDYGIKGFEEKFCVERKQVSDFYSYIGKERNRTTRKMEQFMGMVSRGGWVGLVVEATEADILTGYVMSRVSPETARQALVSFEIRYGVHVYYSRSRTLSSLREEILEILKGIKIQPLRIPILNHWTIKPLKREEIKDFLSQEIGRPVYWVRCIVKLLQEGFTQFIEVGHETTLTKLMRWINREAEAFSAGDHR